MEQEELNDEFKTVQVYGRLITKDDPKFDTLFGSSVEKVPVNKDEIVLPIFDVVFEDFKRHPTGELREMIQSEIDESAMDSRNIAKTVHETDPQHIVDQPPFGEPTTSAVPVGQIAVSPSHSGLISKMDFAQLSDMGGE